MALSVNQPPQFDAGRATAGAPWLPFPPSCCRTRSPLPEPPETIPAAPGRGGGAPTPKWCRCKRAGCCAECRASWSPGLALAAPRRCAPSGPILNVLCDRNRGRGGGPCRRYRPRRLPPGPSGRSPRRRGSSACARSRPAPGPGRLGHRAARYKKKAAWAGLSCPRRAGGRAFALTRPASPWTWARWSRPTARATRSRAGAIQGAELGADGKGRP